MLAARLQNFYARCEQRIETGLTPRHCSPDGRRGNARGCSNSVQRFSWLVGCPIAPAERSEGKLVLLFRRRLKGRHSWVENASFHDAIDV